MSVSDAAEALGLDPETPLLGYVVKGDLLRSNPELISGLDVKGLAQLTQGSQTTLTISDQNKGNLVLASTPLASVGWILVSEIPESDLYQDINAVFYNEFFTILILADVFILLLSFQYTERYSQLIRNTGFIICTILIRLSFSTSGLTNILLIASSVLFGLIILKTYLAIEKDTQNQ